MLFQGLQLFKIRKIITILTGSNVDDSWKDLAIRNKESFASNTIVWGSESNSSDRHLSAQLFSASTLFITVESGLLAASSQTLSLDVKILFFIAFILFVASLIFGILYIFELRSFFSQAVKDNSACEEVWKRLPNSEEEYVKRSRESDKIVDNMVTQSPQATIYAQAGSLAVGLLFVISGLVVYLF